VRNVCVLLFLRFFLTQQDNSAQVQKEAKSIRGGSRTRDLLLRRQTRYPLRYTDALGATHSNLCFSAPQMLSLMDSKTELFKYSSFFSWAPKEKEKGSVHSAGFEPARTMSNGA
jgi:hypothetical protein